MKLILRPSIESFLENVPWAFKMFASYSFLRWYIYKCQLGHDGWWGCSSILQPGWLFCLYGFSKYSKYGIEIFSHSFWIVFYQFCQSFINIFWVLSYEFIHFKLLQLPETLAFYYYEISILFSNNIKNLFCLIII